MTTSEITRPGVRSPGQLRRSARYVAAALSGLVAVLYLTLLFLVAGAERDPVEDTTYGAYLFLAVPYVLGVVLLVATDNRIVPALGATLQIAVIVLFLLFGLGLINVGGVFTYPALSGLHMVWWAVGITGLQLAILVLLAYLSFTSSSTPVTREG